MIKNVEIDPRYRWSSITGKDVTVHFFGNEKLANHLFEALISDVSFNHNHLAVTLLSCKGNFAFIAEFSDYVICAADKVRSFPIFYYENGDEFCASNSARRLKGKYEIESLNNESLLEFRMAGYVTDRDTLFENLYQVQAGEYIIWHKKRKKIERKRYFLFYTPEVRNETIDNLIDELDEITTCIFQRCIDNACGRPIFVPLSGGLDSRLIICKLKQLGYDNLHSFSYGPPGNYEAKAAKYIANKLGVPWTFVPCERKESKKFFESEIRKDYWNFSDGLCCISFMQDIQPLMKLSNLGIMPQDSILINGQTGDFISGGHIQNSFLDNDVSPQAYVNALINKHYSQWLNLKTEENLKIISNKIYKVIGDFALDNGIDYKLCECWEWQERQSKYVVNGQRSYDYMSLAWELPLWQDEYLSFWSKISLKLKYDQLLYRLYLTKYNYKQLFKEFQPRIWRWPGSSICVLPVAFMIGKVFGNYSKGSFYKYMSYFGHYSNHFAPYPINYYFKNIKNARGAIAFYIDTWQKENCL